jgi:hypothetical protein
MDGLLCAANVTPLDGRPANGFNPAMTESKLTKIALYPFAGVTGPWVDDPFDTSMLPATLVPGVTIEDVTPLINEDTFSWLGDQLGKRDTEAMQEIRYAIVHRYEPDIYGESDPKAEKLVRTLSACLRLVRPMRQDASFTRGTIRENKFQVDHFEHPNNLMEVPDVQKLFLLRNKDLVRLQNVAGSFLKAMEGEFWKFRMGVSLHEAGHFAALHWKGRMSLWCSALESIFTSRSPEHKGSLVAKERIKWFLGAATCIYAPGDMLSFEPQAKIAIGDVIDELYELRNCLAHGEKTPDRFFAIKRTSLGEDLNLLGVLHEAISFIIRESLLRILEADLLHHFADGPASEAYFGAAGLTDSQIRQRQRALPPQAKGA